MRRFLVLIILTVFINNIDAKPLLRYRIRRNAVKDESRLWPNSTVIYSIENDFNNKELEFIKKGMKDISSVSCIRFKQHTDEEGYVTIYKGDGCSATVGYTGHQQRLSLASGCFKMKTVYHEFFHSFGFYHEHSRPDRDRYVIVNDHNIRQGKKRNFRKLSLSDVTTFGLPYDYNSVLQYHDLSFSIDRMWKKTLKSTVGNGDINEAVEMSLWDIMKLNLLYRCLL